MNLHIKDKLALVDLATLGSKARRYVKPDVLISDSHGAPFIKGDMLDANATYNLIQSALENIGEGVNIKNDIDGLKEKVSILENLTEILKDQIEEIKNSDGSADIPDDLLDDIDDLKQDVQKLKDLILNTEQSSVKNVILTQSEYDVLQTYEADTIYFVVEDVSNSWTFGKQFPIIFGSDWTFGNQFPLNLK